MTNECQPRGTAVPRGRPETHGQDPPNDILINRCAESQIDLLGSLRTSPTRIPPLHLDDSLDQICSRALRPRLRSLLW